MILHRHVEQEEGLMGIPLLVKMDHIFKISGVTDIVAKGFRIRKLILDGIEPLHSKKRIGRRPAIADCKIRMVGRRTVAQRPQLIGNRLLLTSHILHIGAAAHWKIIQTVPGQKFILRVGGAASVNGYQNLSLYGILFHSMDIRKGFCLGFKAVYLRHVCQSFIHDDDDIGEAAFRSLGLCLAEQSLRLLCLCLQ